MSRLFNMLFRLVIAFHVHALEKEMATHSSVLAWRIPGTGSLLGCCLWGHTVSDTTEAAYQQQQLLCCRRILYHLSHQGILILSKYKSSLYVASFSGFPFHLKSKYVILAYKI